MSVDPPELKVGAETPRVDPEDRAAFEARAERDLAETEAEQDPVKALGFDVTELAPTDFERLGIALAPLDRRRDVAMTGRVWLTHSEVAGRYPGADKIARSLARSAAAIYWSRKRTLRGLRLHRTFPCLGKYRVQNEGVETGPLIVVCEMCGDSFGVRRDEFDRALTDSLA